jgi:hypothetical protein
LFSGDHFRQALPRLFSKRLMRFRRIDALQTDAMLRVVCIEYRDRVAVSNAHHAAVEGLTAGRWRLPLRGLTLRPPGTADAEEKREGNQPNEPRRAFRVD